VINTFIGSPFQTGVFTTSDLLHEVQLQEQLGHPFNIQARRIVRVVLFAMQCLGNAVLTVFDELRIIQITAIGGTRK
jgi:hypothetical protein